MQEEGELYCIANQCPHMSAPLQYARVIGHSVRCPKHGMQFDLRSGAAFDSSKCQEKLIFLPLIYEGNQVGVDIYDIDKRMK